MTKIRTTPPKISQTVAEGASRLTKALTDLPKEKMADVVGSLPGKVSDVAKTLVGKRADQLIQSRGVQQLTGLIVPRDLKVPAPLEGAFTKGGASLAVIKEAAQDYLESGSKLDLDRLQKRLVQAAEANGIGPGQLDALADKVENLKKLLDTKALAMAGKGVNGKLQELVESQIPEVISDIRSRFVHVAFGKLAQDAKSQGAI